MPSPLTHDAPLTERWRYALKPASWPKVLAPAALGVSLAVSHPAARVGEGLQIGRAHV